MEKVNIDDLVFNLSSKGIYEELKRNKERIDIDNLEKDLDYVIYEKERLQGLEFKDLDLKEKLREVLREIEFDIDIIEDKYKLKETMDVINLDYYNQMITIKINTIGFFKFYKIKVDFDNDKIIINKCL